MVQIHLTLSASPALSGTFAHDEQGTAGALVVGVEGLVARLELELAIPPPPSLASRILGLLRGETPTASPDPVGEAADSLRLADSLRAERVAFAKLPARWRGPLERAMHSTGSLADRVERILTRLGGRPRAGAIVVHAARERWPGVILGLLDALDRGGGVVSWASEPTRTTSLPGVELVRGRSPSVVADAVVEGLLCEGSSETLWVAPESLVDHALAARGMPLCGVATTRHPAVGLLGRVIALACATWDPTDALDLLTSPCLPLERNTSRRLCAALCEWPSWHNPAWDEACRAIDDASEASPPALTWLRECLSPIAESDMELPVEHIRSRVSRLGVIAGETREVRGEALAVLCDRFVSLLDAWGAPIATRALLDGLVALAESELPAVALGLPQVGALAVPALSSVIGGAEHLVVWNAAAPPRDPFAVLLPSERAALRAAGATIPDASALVSWWHDDLRRAITRTRRRVWLCLPDVDTHGAALDAPSWGADLEEWLHEDHGAKLELHAPPTRSVDRAATPRHRRTWNVPADRIAPRHRESPSSVMTALGCPLRHALRYHADLGEVFAPTLPEGGLLHGRLAHALFEDVWSGVSDVPDPDVIAARLAVRFDETLPRRALTLASPTAKARRSMVRDTIVRAGAALAQALRDDGA